MFNSVRKVVSSLLVVSHLLLVGCASSSKNISAQYVSPMIYHDYSCNQIAAELSRVSRRVNEIAGVQDSQATKDAVALGVGLVIFWPALFFLIGDDKKEELGRLKGEYEALEQAAIQKDCPVVQQIQETRQAQETEKEAGEREEEKGDRGALN